MHATIDVRLTVSIEEDKTLTLAAIADAVTEQDLDSTILEELVGSLDQELVEEYCGEKHARGNGDSRYQRAGTASRSATTTAGEHEFDLHYVHDTDEDSYFRPIEDVMAFDGQNHYQEDLTFRAAKAATKLSYRDAAEQSAEFTSGLSRSTIHRRAKRFGSQLREFLHETVAGTEAETVMTDGTKCHSQEDGVSFNNVHLTLNRDVVGDDGETTLLDVNVDSSWSETASTLQETEAVAEDAFLVSDAEEPLIRAFCKGDPYRHQLDLVHLPRTLSHHLWDDGAFPLAEREQIVSEIQADVFHLKNSVEKHRSAKEFDAIAHRIEVTKDRLGQLAHQLKQLGSPTAAQYLRSWEDSIVRFGRLAIDGGTVPWTSNAVERAMGEVSKRCKNQWMRWTAAGLESILTLNLVRYANPAQFKEFEDEVLGRSTKTILSMEVSASPNRGEL